MSEYNIISTSSLNSISLTANINSAITRDLTGNYGLVGGSFNNDRADEFNAYYNLPTGSISFPLGNIDAILPDTTNGGSFTPIITITVDKEGTLSASVDIEGDSITATIPEKINKAQVVEWSTQDTPIVEESTQDILRAMITKEDITNHFSNAIKTVIDTYSYNILSSWNMEITPIPAESKSIITQYANNNNRHDTNIFEDGEQIVLNTTYPYSVEVTDLDGNQQTIVANTDIYAIVTHSESAPPLL